MRSLSDWQGKKPSGPHQAASANVMRFKVKEVFFPCLISFLTRLHGAGDFAWPVRRRQPKAAVQNTAAFAKIVEGSRAALFSLCVCAQGRQGFPGRRKQLPAFRLAQEPGRKGFHLHGEQPQAHGREHILPLVQLGGNQPEIG